MIGWFGLVYGVLNFVRQDDRAYMALVTQMEKQIYKVKTNGYFTDCAPLPFWGGVHVYTPSLTCRCSHYYTWNPSVKSNSNQLDNQSKS